MPPRMANWTYLRVPPLGEVYKASEPFLGKSFAIVRLTVDKMQRMNGLMWPVSTTYRLVGEMGRVCKGDGDGPEMGRSGLVRA